MGINSGRLDTRVRFRVLTTSTDDMGATTESWADLSSAPTMAEYIPLRGQERMMAGQLAAVVEFKLRIRRDSSITSANKVIVDETTTCDILGVEDYKRRGRDMVLHCREVQ